MHLQYYYLCQIHNQSINNTEIISKSCSLFCTCAARAHVNLRDKGSKFLLRNLSGSRSWLSNIMFRAAVRLSVSGVRSLTRTQPGCQGVYYLGYHV